MKLSRLLPIVLLLALAAGAPLLAATANFQGNCASGIPTVCSFDAGRAPAGQSTTSCGLVRVNQYFWNFDSGSSTAYLWTTSATASYTYTGAYCDFVDLAVFCNDNTSATKSHCLCNNIGIGGCIIPGAGWTP